LYTDTMLGLLAAVYATSGSTREGHWEHVVNVNDRTQLSDHLTVTKL